MSTTDDSMIMPATSDVVSATSHWAVKMLERTDDQDDADHHADPGPLGGEGERLAALDDAAPHRQPVDPRKNSTSTMASSGTSSRTPLAGSQSGHHDWSAISTIAGLEHADEEPAERPPGGSRSGCRPARRPAPGRRTG